MEQLLNYLNPFYVSGRIVDELSGAFSVVDLTQPHTWLFVASSLCLGQAVSLVIAWCEEKLEALRKSKDLEP